MKYKKKEFAEKHGLTCGKHCVWGVYEGYHVHIKYTPVGNPRCLITVVTAAGGKEKSLEKYLGAQKNKLNISNFGVVKLGLMVCPKFTGEVFARAEHILDEICAHLKKRGSRAQTFARTAARPSRRAACLPPSRISRSAYTRAATRRRLPARAKRTG